MSETPYPNDPPTSRWPRQERPFSRPSPYSPTPIYRKPVGLKPEKKEYLKGYHEDDDPADMETKRARQLDSMARERAQERFSQEISDAFNRKLKEKLQEKITNNIVNDISNKLLLELQQNQGMYIPPPTSIPLLIPSNSKASLDRSGLHAPRPGGPPPGGDYGLTIEIPLPSLAQTAAAAAGTAIGTGLAYGANSAMDANDIDTWKTGGSRAKTQVDLLTGDSDTWRNVRDEFLQSSNMNTSWGKRRLEKEVVDANERDKIQVQKNNPNIKKGKNYEREVHYLWNATKARLGKDAKDDDIVKDAQFQKKMTELSAAAMQ